jgi:hypothetical protein
MKGPHPRPREDVRGRRAWREEVIGVKVKTDVNGGGVVMAD